MTFHASEAPLGTASRQRWSDWANMILSALLFISPWILAYGAGAAGDRAAWNAWIGGAISFFVALSTLGRGAARWQEGLNLILGAWFFIAPWVLGFVGHQVAPAATNGATPNGAPAAFTTGSPAASWAHWILGALIFLCSAYALYIAGRQSREYVAERRMDERRMDERRVDETDRTPRGRI